MGRTSAAVKYRYNSKAYDQVSVRLPKGDRELIKAAADLNGLSMAAYIRQCLIAAGCPLDRSEAPSETTSLDDG